MISPVWAATQKPIGLENWKTKGNRRHTEAQETAKSPAFGIFVSAVKMVVVEVIAVSLGCGTVRLYEKPLISGFSEMYTSFTKIRKGNDMDMQKLIECAKNKSGLSLGEMAKRLGKSQARISEWKSGKQKPDANEIAFFADVAGLPLLATVAEVETNLHPEYAMLWKKAVSELRQNRG